MEDAVTPLSILITLAIIAGAGLVLWGIARGIIFLVDNRSKTKNNSLRKIS
jgi:hypothetical protein